MIRYELHFQELFAGAALRAEIDGRAIELPLLTTNFSVGLAHIETVEAPDGADLHLEMSQPPAALRLRLEAARPIVLIRLDAGRLSARMTDRSPGYL